MKSFWKQLHTPRAGAVLAGLLSLLVLLPIWYLLGNWYQKNLIQQERAKAAEQIAAHANALSAAVQERISLLQGLYAFTRTEWPDTTFDQPFENYSAGVYFNSTGVSTLMIAPEGIDRYIFPIYVSPLLSGYDVIHDPDPMIRNDVQRAILNRTITLSQPGELKQGGFGLTAWQVVYRGSEMWGLVSISIDMNTVLQDAGLTNPANESGIAIHDNVGHTFFGSQNIWQNDPVVQTIGLSEGSWEMGSAPQEGWLTAVNSQENLFRLSSLVVVGLVALLMSLTVNRQAQLSQAVAMRTREIEQARQELEQRVQERTHELSALLDVSRRIGSTLALDPLLELILTEIKPVLDYTSAYIFRLDENGKLILVSQAGEVSPTSGTPILSCSFESHQKQVIDSLQPVIEWDWSADGDCPGKLCWMGVPLVIKDRATGMLVFIHQDSHFYKDEHARLALTFAQQVAVAIENARLYEQAGQLAVLEERQRLARELHDSVSQVLYSIGLGAKTARSALEKDPSQVVDALDYVNWLAKAGQVEMRSLIFELRPESLRTDGLVAALEKQIAVLRTRHKLSVQADLCPEPDIPLDIKEILYRISQEAIHNIVKHAHATQVILVLECSDQQGRLEVNDNGVGFDSSAAYPGHLGLQSMQERALQWHAQFQIDSAPGMGTRILFVIPLK